MINDAGPVSNGCGSGDTSNSAQQAREMEAAAEKLNVPDTSTPQVPSAHDPGRDMGSSFSIPISNESTQSEGQTAQLGIGVSAFLIAGVSAEIGLCYSDQAGLDLYLTGGIGYGVGVSTKVTGNYNVVSSTDLNFSTGQTATMGMGLAATYDMKARQFTGVSGLGAGGGVLYTGTVTLKGLWRTVFGK